MSTPVQLTPPILPEGVCFANEQERANSFFELASAQISGEFTSWNVGTSTPTVDNQDKPWLKLNSDGSPEGSYAFSSGAWVRPYPVPPGPNAVRWLWTSDQATLDTFDGGSAGAVTNTTGPFWTIDTDFADKIPIGAGTVAAVGVDAAKVNMTGAQKVRGVNFIKRTTRKYIVG